MRHKVHTIYKDLTWVFKDFHIVVVKGVLVTFEDEIDLHEIRREPPKVD